MPTVRRECSWHDTTHEESKFKTPRSRVCIKGTKERIALNNRAKALKAKYGITLEDYKKLLEAQRGCCAICGGSRKYNLHVDHDHKRQKALLASGVGEEDAARLSIRGLLCARCNKVLRDARDSRPLFAAVVMYLDFPPAQRVLAA